MLSKNKIIFIKGNITFSIVKIISTRIGDIIGEHSIIFDCCNETLEITHRAYNRDIFANGVIDTIIWITNKNKGLFDMQDVIGM